MARTFQFELFADMFAVCRLDPDTIVPDLRSDSFVSWTHTAGETSIICPWQAPPKGARIEGPFRCLRIVGALDFNEVGIIAEISGLLASARISLLTISTFDTDYFFVRAESLAATLDLLTAAGHQFVSTANP